MPVAEQKTTTRVELNNVLFATDFSVSAQAALPYALGAPTHFPWSTAHRVIAGAPCPVLTVRN
jgi:hypothetical protein